MDKGLERAHLHCMVVGIFLFT